MEHADIPAHVPGHLVIDFDYINPPGVEEDVHLAWKRLHEGPDIFWTPRNGGHWVVTRGDDVEHFQRNHRLFSNEGITVPKLKLPYRLLPSQLDPPEHAPYRALVQSFFLPKAVENLESDARAICRQLIADLRLRGRCEFMADFARQLPIVIFLKMVDLPLTDSDQLLGYTENVTRGASAETREQAGADLMQYLDVWIERRRANPGPDMISKVVHARIEGRALDEADIRGLLFILLFGGLDTISAMLGFFAKFLAEHPLHRRQLVEQPVLISQAAEELIRRHGVASQGREVLADLDYKGVYLRKGDLVWVPSQMYGLDERKFENPLEVDFHRKNVIHTSFGSGIHRCPGSYLARTELWVFLEEWLREIPDFRIARGQRAVCQPGLVNSLRVLPLEWDVS